MKSQLPNTAQGYIIMLAGFRDKRFAKNGYFYEVLQAHVWMHALDNVLLRSYGAQLEAHLETIPDHEDPLIKKIV